MHNCRDHVIFSQAVYVVLFFASVILDEQGFRLFYIALWEDEEVAFLRLTCKVQAVNFELDRVIDANPRAANRLRRIAIARRAILEGRVKKALKDSTFYSSVRSRGGGGDNHEIDISDLGFRTNRMQPLSDSAKRALADIAARMQQSGDWRPGDARGNPQTAALYMKLCEHYDNLRVCPEMLNDSDAQTAEWASRTAVSLETLAAAFNRRVTGETSEEAREEGQLEATKLIEGAATTCCAGRLNFVGMSQAAFNTLEDPASLNLLRRGFLLRHFIRALFVINVWFQHTYLSVFTRFDPWSPRTQRITQLICTLWASLFINSFFYAYAAGTPGKPLGPLTLSETLVLALSE